jgi:hypothetical protein
MRLSRSSDCPSDLTLDAWANGELDVSLIEPTRSHLAECARCQVRHETHARERAEFYEAAPTFEAHARRFVPERSTPVRRRSTPTMIAGGIAALAAVALLTVLETREENRLKGRPSIGFHVKRGDQVQESDGTMTLRPGDLLRFTYTIDRDRYFALFNRDQRTASVFYPQGEQALLLRAGREVPLPFSVELDDTPGPESVYGVFCLERFELAPLRAALERTGRLPAPPGCQVDARTLHKEASK